jgi:RNA recognition motif-containing protein
LKSIFVGNLDFGTTEDSIRNLFEKHGAVDRVNVIRDRDTGQPRGFAFVEMADSSEADRAITALNGASLDGRAINVNEARPRAERAGHGGGGGGGFRGNRSGGGGGRPGGGGGRGGRREPRW